MGASPAFGELTLSSVYLHASLLRVLTRGSQDSRDIAGLLCGDPFLMDLIHLLSECGASVKDEVFRGSHLTFQRVIGIHAQF